jgi:integrase
LNWNYILVPDIQFLDESDNVREGFFEKSEFDAVHKHLPEYLKDFVLFFYTTGMRPKEIKSLQWRDVDKQDVLTLQRKATKSKKTARKIPMHARSKWAIPSKYRNLFFIARASPSATHGKTRRTRARLRAFPICSTTAAGQRSAT